MHAFIYQISQEEIEVNIDVDTVTLCDGCDIDYCSQISSEEITEAIKDLVNNYLPKGMFEIVDNNTIKYLGGIKEYADKWIKDIQSVTMKLTQDDVLRDKGEFFNLKQKIRNPFHTPNLFYTDAEALSCYASMSGDFITDVLCRLKPNDLLHIGGVLNFHF